MITIDFEAIALATDGEYVKMMVFPIGDAPFVIEFPVEYLKEALKVWESTQDPGFGDRKSSDLGTAQS